MDEDKKHENGLIKMLRKGILDLKDSKLWDEFREEHFPFLEETPDTSADENKEEIYKPKDDDKYKK